MNPGFSCTRISLKRTENNKFLGKTRARAIFRSPKILVGQNTAKSSLGVVTQSFNEGHKLRLPSVLSGSNLPSPILPSPTLPSTVLESKNENLDLRSLRKQRSKNLEPKSPVNPSVKFYATQAYTDSEFNRGSILDTEEALTPLDKTSKELQEHFVSMCDKNSQFMYTNSNLSRQSFKNFLSKRYCKNMVERILTVMKFPQIASFDSFCRSFMHILELSPKEKMRLAFDFYAHRYDNKITIQDGFTVMAHLAKDDVLLMQRDVNEIFKGLSKVKKERNLSVKSPQNTWKSAERSDAGMAMTKKFSPEKEVFAIKKIIKKRRKNKSKRNIRQGKVAKSMALSPESIRDSQPSKNLSRMVNSFATNKNFFEYSAEIHDRVLRTQKYRQEEVNITNVKKSKVSFNMGCNPKMEFSSLMNSKNEECRRGISSMNTSAFNPWQCFKLYIEDKNLQENKEFLTFEDFCELDFKGSYPEVINDVCYFIARYKLSNNKEIEEPGYYSKLHKQINKLPIISDSKHLARRKKEGWRFDEEEINHRINMLTKEME